MGSSYILEVSINMHATYITLVLKAQVIQNKNNTTDARLACTTTYMGNFDITNNAAYGVCAT